MARTPSNTEDPVSQVMVSRFKRAYWPKEILGCYDDRTRVLAAKRVQDFREMNRDEAYDFGRVRFMVDELKAGKTLDPVQIDFLWSGGRPYRADLLDGHHRFAAHVLARKRFMPAVLGGRLDDIWWLEGKTKVKPD